MEEQQTLSEYLVQFLPVSQRIKARRLLTEDDYRLIYTKAEKEADAGKNITESFQYLAMEYMILKQFYANGEDPKKMIIENLIKTWLREFDMSSEKFELTESEKGSKEDEKNIRFIATPKSQNLNEILDLFENDDRRVKRMVLQLVADSSDYGIKVDIKDKHLLFSI